MSQQPGAKPERPSLDAIGLKWGTDKASRDHGYLDFYELFFRDLRDRPISLLEIGVANGNSLRTWRDYFPSARIVGVDINPTARNHADSRITIEIADQSNVAELVNLGVRHGPFDIVIEDGSHFWDHQITTLQCLFPFVKPRGLYVSEDIDTSFGAHEHIYRKAANVSAMRYLQKLSDYVVADAQLDPAAEEDAFIRTFARETEFIAFHRRTAVLRRRLTPVPIAVPNEAFAAPPPLLELEASAEILASASLTVHLPGRGDVTNDNALIGGVAGSRNAIQGFSLQCTQGLSEGLKYRALLNEMVWTDWVSCGTYVGTRGKGVPIRGFAVRLDGEMARRFVCTYAGAFIGHTNLIEAADGNECRAPDGRELEAMQIVLSPR
jgi:hypothetical protein